MTDAATLRDRIAAQNTKFMQAAERGDAAALATLYTDDACKILRVLVRKSIGHPIGAFQGAEVEFKGKTVVEHFCVANSSFR